MNKDLLPYNNVEIMQYINTHLPNQVIHLKLHKFGKKKKMYLNYGHGREMLYM